MSLGDGNSESILLGSPGGNSHSFLLSSLFVLFYFLKHIYIFVISLYLDVYRYCLFSCLAFPLNGPTSTTKKEWTNLCPIHVPLEGVTGSFDLHYLSLHLCTLADLLWTQGVHCGLSTRNGSKHRVQESFPACQGR